jgi:SAM-dependent methyltransferase
MAIFSDYARYYNLLYQDKDYEGEAEYVSSLLELYSPAACSILELGCGTGRHAELLSQKGHSVHGVELSLDMLRQAVPRAQDNASLQFSHDDIRTVRLAKTFDAVLSLFHVISYQTTAAGLSAVFRTIREHLKPGGIVIFDCWYGPCVLVEQPEVRVKRFADDKIEITRLAEPQLYPNENRVDVAYHFFVRDKAGGSVTEFSEVHHMRYLFKPEIVVLLEQSGLELLHAEEWMTGRPLGCDTWGACFVARADGAP